MSVIQTSTTAPIVKIAAGAVILLCAVGVAAMTGVIPGVSSQEKAPAMQDRPAAETIAPQEPVVSAPAKTHAVEKHAPAGRVAKEPTRVAAAAPVCVECGVVESVQAVEVKGEASGAGAIAGGLAGLVLGNQIGQGKGRTLAKVAGAAGGAYAGHQIEKNVKKTVQYQVAVRMNDGTYRTLSQPNADGLSAGTRVRVVGDAIMRD